MLSINRSGWQRTNGCQTLLERNSRAVPGCFEYCAHNVQKMAPHGSVELALADKDAVFDTALPVSPHQCNLCSL